MAEHSRVAEHDGPLVAAARTAEHTARSIRDTSIAKAESALEASRERISENPMKSVLIAAGVGALVGYLIGRRR